MESGYADVLDDLQIQYRHIIRTIQARTFRQKRGPETEGSRPAWGGSLSQRHGGRLGRVVAGVSLGERAVFQCVARHIGERP